MPADATDWNSTRNSDFTFEATFEGAALPGRFKEFNVALDFDPARPETGALRVTVDLPAADLGDAEMNTVLFDAAWFDIASFIEAVFVSDTIAATAPGQFVATGMLDLKGVRKPVVFPFSWTSSGDTATMRGEFSLKRTDFAVGSGEWASDASIGTSVGLSFTIELVRSGQ